LINNSLLDRFTAVKLAVRASGKPGPPPVSCCLRQERPGNAFLGRPAGANLVLSGIQHREFDHAGDTRLVMTVRIYCAFSTAFRVALFAVLAGVIVGLVIAGQLSSVPGS
jgi:hypothetical protein